MSDLVNFICQRAVRRFGDSGDGLFNAACFSSAWRDVTGLKSGLDGYAVAAMLHGRHDVEPLTGAHYRLATPTEDRRHE